MRRRLSPSERFDWLVTKDFPNVFATVARVRGHCGTEELRAALEAACRRHPTLRSRVVTRPYPLVPVLSSDNVEPLPLRVVSDAGDDDWIGVVEDELERPFDLRRGPLVRCVLLNGHSGFDLILVTSHLLADGMSLVNLIRDLLEYLACPGQPVTVHESPPGWDALREQADAPAPRPPASTRPPAPALPAGFHQPGAPTGPFTVQHWAWSPAHSAALLERCRAERTTVHAALAVAVLRALAALDDGHPVRRLGSPISTRRYLSADYQRAFGGYVGPSAMVALDSAVDQEFWTATREFKAGLAARTDPASFQTTARVLRVLYRLPEPLARPVIRKWINDEYDAWISNLTRLPIPTQYGQRQLDAVHLAINTGGSRRRVLGVTERHGRIDFTLASSHSELMRAAFERATSELAREIPWPAPGVAALAASPTPGTAALARAAPRPEDQRRDDHA